MYLYIRPQIIKLLEENIGQKIHSTGFGNDFLDMTPKAQATKEKRDKLNLMKNLKFCGSKDTMNRVKRQPTEWEKIFENHISDKGLKSRIDRELLKLNNKKKPWFKTGQGTSVDISPKIYKWLISTCKYVAHH